MNHQKLKSIISNFIRNMFAYAIPVAMIQFVVQPLIASQLGAELNGLFLAIIALNYFVVSLTSGILLQTRLLQNEKYQRNGYVGDYNIILLCMVVVVSAVMAVGTILYMGKSSFSDVILCIIIGILFLIHDYVCVQYRTELNYHKILMSNLVLCIGYLVGLTVFRFIEPKWQLIYIIAYAINEIYDLLNTQCLREPFVKTPLFTDTFKRYVTLASASTLTYVVSYGDRLLLYPLLDGVSVSVLSSAEIMGKVMMLLSTPLTGFMLSYVVRENKIEFRIKPKIWVGIVGGMLFCYAMCCAVSIPMLYFLYPEWAERSMVYVPLVTLTSLVNLISHIANVFVVRFCVSKYQLLINTSYLSSYLLASFILLNIFGLMGFCFGNFIAAAVKLTAILIIWNRKDVRITV